MDSFNILSRALIDTWLTSSNTTSPTEIYSEVAGKLTPKMALFAMRTEACDPYDWHLRRIRNFSFRSSLLAQLAPAFADTALRNLDRDFVDRMMIPAYSRAVMLRRPTKEMVRSQIGTIQVGYERLILPQKTAERPDWCISLVAARYLLPKMLEAKTDAIDENVIQLLIEGHATKEIADWLNLSPRTIEHRLSRLKDRFEAENLVHLVAKIVAAQVSDNSFHLNGEGQWSPAIASTDGTSETVTE